MRRREKGSVGGREKGSVGRRSLIHAQFLPQISDHLLSQSLGRFHDLLEVF